MTADEAKKFGLIDSVVEKENKPQYQQTLQLQLDNKKIENYINLIDSL